MHLFFGVHFGLFVLLCVPALVSAAGFAEQILSWKNSADLWPGQTNSSWGTKWCGGICNSLAGKTNNLCNVTEGYYSRDTPAPPVSETRFFLFSVCSGLCGWMDLCPVAFSENAADVSGTYQVSVSLRIH